MNVRQRKSMTSRISISKKDKTHAVVSDFSRTVDIHVIVEGIENIRGKHEASDVFVQAEFMNIVIGESPQQPISNDACVPHNFHCFLRFYPEISQCIDDLISNPLVFNAYEVEAYYDTEHVFKKKADEDVIAQSTLNVVQSAKVSASKKSDTKSKKGTPDTTKKSTTVAQFHADLIGRCNIDLLPLILGSKEIRETLTLEPDGSVLDDTITSETNLPRLRVRLRSPDPIISPIDLEDGNVFEFSVGSIYNIPSDIMPDNMHYTIATLLPINSEAMESIIIRDGIVRKDVELEKPKMWPGLGGLESRACYSNYKFDWDVLSLKNPLQINVKEVIANSEKRIEWNIMRRIWLRDFGKIAFLEKLKKFRKWPIEILGTRNVTPKEVVFPPSTEVPIVTPSTKEFPQAVDRNDIHLMGFLDLTKLLYAGIKNTRVVCQLHTFNADELKFETGHNVVFRDSFSGISPKSKLSTTKKSKKGDTLSSVDVDLEGDAAESETASTRLKSSYGAPTFIIIEINLWRPFIPKQSIEDLRKHLSDIIPKREPVSHQIVNIKVAENDFTVCVEDILHIIYKEYNNFLDKKNAKQLTNLTGDDDTDFVFFLNETGANSCFKKTLKKRIYHLICEKFPYKETTPNTDITNLDNYTNEVYIYLIKKINTIVNGFIGPSIGLTSSDCDSEVQSVTDFERPYNLFQYAKEAEENGAINLAERYYLELINEDQKNKESWLHYAIFKMGNNEVEEAYKMCQQSLTADSNYKYGLIFLGLVMHRKKNYTKAESCFSTCMTLYPNFLIGWVTFHLFYLSIENYEGVDVTHERIVKCLRDEQFQKIATDFEYLSELSWDVQLWEHHQTYARCAVLLLKFRCFDFVEMALAQDLLTSSDKKCYSYYTAVGFYLAKRFSKALSSVDDVLKIVGPNVTVGGLIGYCHFKLKNYDDASDNFESILQTFDRPTNILLIYTYLTEIYRRARKLEKAIQFILLACKYTPTPHVWLLAGIIYMELNDLQSAEMCLKTSNGLDKKLSETWKYLSMVNVKLDNPTIAEQCLQYSIKYELPKYEPKL